MVGLIQRVLVTMIEEIGGAEARARIFERAGVPADRDFRIDLAYDDGEFRKLLDATCHELGLTQAQVEIAYADHFGRDALERFPAWFELAGDARGLLLRQPAIHDCMAHSIAQPDQRRAIRDKFSITEHGSHLETPYQSENRLCGLYVALARWVIDHYEEDAGVTETACTKAGANACEIEVRWKPS